MRVIAVNHVADLDRRQEIPEGYEIWSTETPIGVSYHRIAQEAVWEGWGTEVVVIQDDVRLNVEPMETTADIKLYGDYRSLPLHACPRAFAAGPSVWERLEHIWSDHPGRLCPTFTAILRSTVKREIVMGGIEHTEPVESRPWPREMP